jgi:hypothetical protein
MFRSRKTIAALIAVTAAGTTLSTATDADAHPLLVIGLAAGALGVAVGSAFAHESQPVVVERGPGDHCVMRQHIGWWGRVRDVEVCR